MSTPAILIENLSKTFRLHEDQVGGGLARLVFPRKQKYREKTALRNVDLRIDKGEIVGVLGPNGAGKTTLLKIIAGISHPTSGTIQVHGRVVAVLALGLGFHQRLTALENIDLAGMMLGMSRTEVRQKRDWIIEFAELGNFASNPISTYSTGMRARLSFAVAACQEPEILIIDEALATGDIRFVQKCINRIHEITKSGTTALFVSHNVWSIKRLTSRSILINDGMIVDDGETSRVADRYYEYMLKTGPQGSYSRDGSQMADFVGTGEAKLVRADLRNKSGQSTTTLISGEGAFLFLELEKLKETGRVSVAVMVNREDGILATSLAGLAGGTLNNKNEFVESIFELQPGYKTIKFDIERLLLSPGAYSIDVHLFDANSYSGFTSNQQFYFKTRVLEFLVESSGTLGMPAVYFQPSSFEISTWTQASIEPN